MDHTVLHAINTIPAFNLISVHQMAVWLAGTCRWYATWHSGNML